MNELLNIMIEAAEKDKNFKLVKKLKPCKNHPLVSVVHRVGKEKKRGRIMNFNQLIHRYEHNPEFHRLVDFFYHLYFDNHFTFFEIKEAMIFAKNKFDMENHIPPYGSYAKN